MNAKIHHSAGRRAVVVLSVALAMLVAACGGSSSDSTSRDDVIALAEASFSADVGLEELPESLKTFVACVVDAVVEEQDLSWSDLERAFDESGDLNSLTSDTYEVSAAGLGCFGELTFEDLVLIGGGSDDDLFDSGASSYGDDPELDALWDACEAGDDVACDDLYWESPLGSEYESFGLSCAGRGCGGEEAVGEAVVVVDGGEEIQIRSLDTITGDLAFIGIPHQNAVMAAIADYGDIKGFSVTMGQGLDDGCSADVADAAAQSIVEDAQIVGVIGTTCSGAAAAAAPLITDAYIVMISGSATSQTLTSDLQGTAGIHYSPGFYRTAHNDLYQGVAMAHFVFGELGMTTAAAIHDGDRYTEGLASAFADAFEQLGGTVTGFEVVDMWETNMVPVLTEIAAGSPEALFVPIFQPTGEFFAAQARGVPGLENVQLLAADSLLNFDYLELSESEGMYFTSLHTDFGASVNQSTGKTAFEVLDDYRADHGEEPSSAYWGSTYDATTILLSAIEANAEVNDAGQLVIDKAGISSSVATLRDYGGLTGSISCDDFGDCGSQKIVIVHHTDSDDAEAGMVNVVFEYAP
jgi:branched-chain amino acid transport system substrate-binding protein